MMKSACTAGILGFVLLMGTVDCHAEKWVKNNLTNNSIQANYHDADSVKVHDKTLRWTEKTVLTEKGVSSYAKVVLGQFSTCKQNAAKKGAVAYHQIDFEIRNGKYRAVAKRNYNEKDEIVCTDKDTGKDLDTSWHKIGRHSSMEETYHNLVTKYKLPDL